MRVLVLGGTAEARALARALADEGISVVSSLAGRVARPALPVGEVRVGGFGGVSGLTEYLRTQHVSAVVDATHPFAAQMSAHAVAAATAAGVPLVRLERPGWAGHPDADRWRWVADAAEAVAAGAAYRRPFLTTGRQSIDAYQVWADKTVLVRVVDPLAGSVPSAWTVITGRGPYTIEGESRLLRDHRADLLVTKDSGGALTAAKLAAARELDVDVLVIRRPELPPAPITVSTAAEVLAALGV